MPYAGYTTEEIARRGTEIYERKLRQEMEREHQGQFVVVDVTSGDYEVADEDLEASERLLARRPEAMLYGQLIGTGSAASARIGSRLESTKTNPRRG